MEVRAHRAVDQQRRVCTEVQRRRSLMWLWPRREQAETRGVTGLARRCLAGDPHRRREFFTSLSFPLSSLFPSPFCFPLTIKLGSGRFCRSITA